MAEKGVEEQVLAMERLRICCKHGWPIFRGVNERDRISCGKEN